MEELDESDIRACGGYLPLGRNGLASGTLGETENGTGLAGGTLMEGSNVDAGFGGSSPATGETAGGESVTNEANLDEEVKSSNYIKEFGFTTTFDVDSGLDKGEIDYDFDGGETAGDADCGEALRVPRAAAVGGAPRLGAGVTTRSVGEAAPTQSVGARGIENSSSERGETLRTRELPTPACGGTSPSSGEEDDELRELQEQLAIETVKKQARAGPMAEAIRDLMASSPEAMELLKEFLPGYRPASVDSG